MPRYLTERALDQLKKTAWRVDLLWIDLPPVVDASSGLETSRNTFLTDHYQDIHVPALDLEPSLDRREPYIFQATSGMLSLGTITDDLDAKDAPLAVNLDGIKREFTSRVLGTKVKGSKVTLYRAFFDDEGGTLTAPPFKRWVGRVDSISITDATNIESAEQSTITIGIDCRNIISLLKTKQSGLYTSESSWNATYPTDTSMHNIAGLVDREFNFGKKD